MANEGNLKPFTGADDPRRGTKPKGAIHLSTHIQNMLNDPKFETMLLDSKKGVVEYKGIPIKAIIAVAIHKALHDKEKGQQWADWLAKYGYGSKNTLEIHDVREEILERFGLHAGEIEETSKSTSDRAT